MLLLRIFGKLLLFIAFLAIAYDGARILATPGEGLLLTSMSTHLRTHIPQAQESLEQFFLANAPSYVWSAFDRADVGGASLYSMRGGWHADFLGGL